MTQSIRCTLTGFVKSFAILLLLAFNVSANDLPLEDPSKEKIARELMKEIRCLVCQNQSIEDSNADLAKDLRKIVREQVNAGKSPEETKAFLVERYGDWVLLKPPFNTGTLFLWASPILFIGLGAFALFRRSQSAPHAPERLSDDERKQLDDIMSTKKGTDG
ncbi:cytochrome c-type biogenesis protein [Kordiimonas sp. SCSIO 12610]|uniref:cytochrome c-type biogenesis protein n=1 Tax=Kordiimonas sp. SCSIO 12610 TaxID=2829597 RepID=UPI00210D8213|nr:cytochrome c-type biogenesis protein [Kordiimonas sp. SCSIO 12610]UTW55626.1 cytochrome c-type biogenesis protein CcmH [Kordiimonas sp. SCSIO 12610]